MQLAHVKSLLAVAETGSIRPAGYCADIISKSSGNQLQLVYTSELDTFGKGRMCVIGDAGMAAQLMTGSGLFKGFSNARDLVRHLDEERDVEMAVAKWSTAQTHVSNKMLALGNQMEEAFIWNTIDLATASTADSETWRDNSTDVPEEFYHFASTL